MLRFLAGVMSTLLLVGGGILIWTSRAGTDETAPPAPAAASRPGSLLQAQSLPEPPAASGANRSS